MVSLGFLREDVIVVFVFVRLCCSSVVDENVTTTTSTTKGTKRSTTEHVTFRPVPRIHVGDKVSVKRKITEEQLMKYAEITGDTNPWYTNVPKLFTGPLLLGLVYGVMGTKLPGPGTMLLNNTMSFPHACYVDQHVTVSVEILDVGNGYQPTANYTVYSHLDKVVCLEGIVYGTICFRYMGPWRFSDSMDTYSAPEEWFPESYYRKREERLKEYPVSSTIYSTDDTSSMIS